MANKQHGAPGVPENLIDMADGTWARKVVVVNSDNTAVGASAATGGLTEATYAARVGEVQATPTANTVLRRLKDLLTGIVLAAGENHVGSVGGHIAVPTATFTRPNTTPTYASGQLVANNASAGSVTPLTLTAARAAAGTLMIRRVRLKKSSTGLTGASFRVHFYKATAPTPSNGDTGAWLTDQAANYLGAFDVTMDKAFTDGAHGSGTPNTGSEVNVALASGTDIYALIEARGAYVGVANETFILAAEVLQN